MLTYEGKATNHSTVTEAMRHRKGPAKGAHTQIHKHAVKTHSQTRQSRTKLPNPLKANTATLKTDTVTACGSLWAFLLTHTHTHIERNYH